MSGAQGGSNEAAPARLAKGALRRLAAERLEPTPENFARAYADEAGEASVLLPERARPVLARLASRVAADDEGRRDELVRQLMQGRWDAVGSWLDAVEPVPGKDWSVLVERVAQGLERGGREWTLARRKESLHRLFDRNRSDPSRLQQRLAGLLSAWEGDTPLPAAEGDAPDPDPDLDPDAPAPAVGAADAAAVPAPAPADWPPLVASLEETVRSALGAPEARARELADRLGLLAGRVAREGCAPALVEEVALLCVEAQRWLGHRHQLVEDLGSLCRELSAGLVELAEDDSWARGQCENLAFRLGDGTSARGVKAAARILEETRERQRQVRAERNAAREALKELIHRMLSEIGELGEHTGRFEESVGRHADAIARADSLESLAGVVREMLDDSRAVQRLVRQAQGRLTEEHARAGELESRVRALEAELRRLSDEVSTDALTQVANRRGLQRAFEQELAVRARQIEGGGAPAPLALGLIDIDNFKRLNDTLGHAAGDAALKSLAAAVRERLRPTDHLARFGGEEFVVLLPATDAQEARQALTRLQRGLTAALFMHGEQEVFVTFSAGVTGWRDGETLEAALERADEALYEAKRAGKNRTCLA